MSGSKASTNSLVSQLAKLDIEVMLLGVVTPKGDITSMDQLRNQLEAQALELQEQGIDLVLPVVVDGHR